MNSSRQPSDKLPLNAKLKTLPDAPGVYLFYDNRGKIIYIGKAKSLKKRITSYFHKEKHEHVKVRLMVKRITDVSFVIVETEFDALLLENTLIKKWQPRYNVLLKDDKTFPWICIKKEAFPRVFSTRRPVKDGSEYFGPYASVKTMNALLELIRRLYKLRNCNLNLSEENIKKGKYKVCLEYHIGNCNGPCCGYETEGAYKETISHIRQLIKGHIGSIVQHMKKMMQAHAKNYAFEEAHVLKEKIELIVNYQKKSTVVSSKISNIDVFSIKSHADIAFVNFFKIINGAIVQSHSIELKKKLKESEAELLGYAITDLRLRLKSDSKEIIVPILPDICLPDIKYTIPQRGEKKHLLELSERNVKYFMMSYLKSLHEKKSITPASRIMASLAVDLKLKEKPVHIECFDISNMQGSDAVAAMSVFINARPSKKMYRIFNIKTVEGPNDYASLEEVVYRRYKKTLEEKNALPQLIIIDGGKGQLSAALKSLRKLDIEHQVSIIGIAKKLEEIFLPGDNIPLYLDKRSESLRLIQKLRNEAHRFGIKHYRIKAEKRLINSELYSIKGIGEKTIEKLMQHFKSVTMLKKADYDEVVRVIGQAKAKILWDGLKE